MFLNNLNYFFSIKPMIYKMIYKHNKQFINSKTVSSGEIAGLIGISDFRTKIQLKQTVIQEMEQLLFGIIKSTSVKNYYEYLSPKYFNVQTQGNDHKIIFVTFNLQYYI